MIWISLLPAVLAAAGVRLLAEWAWRHCGLYAAITLPVAVGLGALCYFLGTRQDYYSEVWNYKVNAVRYYEFWDEEVPCRHPRFVTKSRTVTKTDSKGSSYTTTESYQEQDGYEHPYDVDDHPAHWEAVTEYGDERDIGQGDYGGWKSAWGNEALVGLHHHNVHSRDGNMYQSNWGGDFDRLFPMEDVRSYENRIRVSNSVFNYARVDRETEKRYYRPADKGVTNAVLSYDGTAFTPAEDLMIRRVNATLGRSSRVHAIVLLWDGAKTASTEMNAVLSAWKGPNKNELVIAVGLGPGRKVLWCQCYSWVDDTTIHALVRQDVQNMGTLDFVRLKESLLGRVPANWKKKDFRDFNYIENALPWWSYLLAVVLACGASAGTYFGMRKRCRS